MSRAEMQQALEALEKWETKLRWAAISALKQALAEPEQEHVSLMTVLHLKDRTEIGYGPASAGYDLPTGEYKLYTSPPASKQWVGLTDEERGQVYANWRFNGSGSSNLELCHAIEAKLKEKNA